MYKKSVHIISAAIIFSLSTVPVLAESDSAILDLVKGIEAVALQEIADTGIPSLQISIGAGADLIYEGAFGLTDIENGVQATSRSKYRAASVSKWHTAVAAMLLAQTGTLDLDKPVQSYCPEYPPKTGVITSRQLLTHTAGIRHYVDYEEAIRNADNPQHRAYLEKKAMQETLSTYTRYTDVISPLITFKDDDLLYEPGTDWEYSSFGYRLLACVMQGAAKIPFVDLMKDTVFAPANMNDTKPDDAWAIIQNRATGYRIKRGELRRADLRDVSENLPAGGYLSTASDLVRFALAFNNGILPKSITRVMSSPVAANLDGKSEPSWRDAIPQKDKYGYGLMLLTKYVDGMVGHTGRQPGASAIVVLIPEKERAIAIMTNTKGWNGYLSFVLKLNKLLES